MPKLRLRPNFLALVFLLLAMAVLAVGCDDEEQDEAVGERLDPYDTGGQTPEDIVFQYLSAIQEEDWDTAHNLQTEEDRPDLDVYRAERESSEDRLLRFDVEQRGVLNTATAEVLVTTTIEREGAEAPIRTEEWWTVTKEHGYWRIPLDPVE